MAEREILPTFKKFLHPVGDRRRKFGDQGQYERQICAFIDLLGVRRANKGEPKIREGLLDIFWSVSAISAPFTAHLMPEEPRESFWWGPEISAFSDCVVISYPLNRIETLSRSYDMPVVENVFVQLRYIIGTLAAACLTQGFLIRGGITVGDLYHADSVILGPALDGAYELEREKAVYPRVVLSEAVQQLLISDYGRRPLMRGPLDELFYFDYMSDMILESAPTDNMLPEYSEETDFNDGKGEYAGKLRVWLASAIDVINYNLSHQIDLSIRAKWIWFAREFQATMTDRLKRWIIEDYELSEFRNRLIIPTQ